MNFSFKSFLGTVLRGARSIREVVDSGASVKKEEQNNLSVSYRLKLTKAEREGGTENLTLFESDGQSRGNFGTVNDLRMRLEPLSKATTFYDMGDMFKILPINTITLLESKLEECFNS